MSSEEEDPYKRLLGSLTGSTIQALSKKMKLDVADDSSQSLEGGSYAEASNDASGESENGESLESGGSEDESLGEEDIFERGESEEEEDEENEDAGSSEGADPEDEGEGEEEKEQEDEEEQPDRPEEALVAGSLTSSYLKRFSDRPDKELRALMNQQPKLKSRTFEVSRLTIT